MCVGPVRTDVTLGDRLVQEGMISESAWLEALHLLGASAASETSVALTLMDLNYVKREELREWMTRKVTEVLRVLLTWKKGTIQFEENVSVPAERLLVSLALSSLVDTINDVTSVASHEDVQEVYANVETQLMPASQVKVSLAQAPGRQDTSRRHVGYQRRMHSAPSPLPPVAWSVEASSSVQGTHAPVMPQVAPDISKSPTLFESAQFLARTTESPLPLSPSLSPIAAPEETPSTMSVSSLIDVDMLVAKLHPAENEVTPLSIKDMFPPVTPPTVPAYAAPRRVNTSFMQPTMVMVPVKQSVAKEQHVQLTPAQWQVLSHVDGHTSLQELEMNMARRVPIEQVYQIVGELMAEQLIEVVPPQALQAQVSGTSRPTSPVELSPASHELVRAGLQNGVVTPGHSASIGPVWGDAYPSSNVTQLSPTVVTQSQWGNGGNGATFVPGQGWVTAPQSLQPSTTNGPRSFTSGTAPTMQRK
jgi:hypothetical protein